MRVNVYAEELTTETELVTKRAETGVTFYGIRLFLESADALHHRADDDDRSAITLFVPWTARDGHDFGFMSEVFASMQTTLSAAMRCDMQDRTAQRSEARARETETTLDPAAFERVRNSVISAIKSTSPQARRRLLNSIAEDLGLDEDDLEGDD